MFFLQWKVYFFNVYMLVIHSFDSSLLQYTIKTGAKAPQRLIINITLYLHYLKLLGEANPRQSFQRDKQMVTLPPFLPCSSSNETQVANLHILYLQILTRMR